jgi:subtilisin-like proprotein convertase family protein
MSYDGYGDQDALIPDAAVEILYEWSSYGSQGGVLIYDDNPDPQSGQIVFFSFDYGNVTDSQGRKDLLENAISHLLAPESTPEGSVSGTVRLFDEDTHGGVTVRTSPMGLTDTTDDSGDYRVDGLYNGTYTLTASKAGFADSTVTIEIVDGATLENVDFMLFPVFEYMDHPAVAIPDNNSAGIRVYLDVPDDLEITAVDCYVNLTHSFRGDLVAELTSPAGTTVRLHNRTGGSADDIVTWYDLETPCDGPGSMDDFAGESTLGQWELHVSDQASYDTGTLQTWGLRVYSPLLTGADREITRGIPRAHFLAQNYPNPFNPLTHVRFGLPKTGRAEVAIFNVRGQRVVTLTSGTLAAGIHSVAWDGTDLHGRPVASGIYFCRFKAENYEAVQRMVLMK